MKYDKKSFLAGIEVGRTLSGWACGGGMGGVGGELSEIVVRSGTADFIEVPAEGFYGIGKVTVVGDADLVPANIKYGVNILGVTGTYAPADPALASATKTITSNGKHTIYPPSGYVGMTRLVLTVDVPTTPVVVDAVLQSKSVTPGYSSKTVTPDSGYNGLSSVTVAGDPDLIASNIREGVTIFGVTGSYVKTEIIDAVLQYKSVTPGRSSQNVYPDSGYNGLSRVYVAGDSSLIPSNIREGVTIFGVAGSYSTDQKYQSKTVTPTKSGFTVTADSGYNALASVKVNGDSNLVAGNIAAGKTIFGVKGSYISPMKPITVIPSLDEQYILPADGFVGFSSITVAPAEATGDYNEGFAAGVASRDAEVAELQAQIEALTAERDAAYKNGYTVGYDAGAADIAASYQDLDEEEF